jgi:hypothetical protein
VGVVVRLKKWVKTVGNVFLFSMVFAHGCAAIFKLSINLSCSLFVVDFRGGYDLLRS